MGVYPYDTSNVPPGGDKGQVLTKESDRSYDVGWHKLEDVVIDNVASTVDTVLDERINELNGKPNQILGFDSNGNIVPIDFSATSDIPDIATDDEFDEMLNEIFR